MAGLLGAANSEEISPAAWCFSADVREDERGDFAAFPGIHFINMATGALKGAINNGQGCSFGKACAYLGYRVISYSCIPLVLNLVSLVVCTLLTILTIPTRCCGEGLNRWCWVRTQGSFGFLMQSLFDLTCDFRQVTGCCCCPPESLYRQI